MVVCTSICIRIQRKPCVSRPPCRLSPPVSQSCQDLSAVRDPKTFPKYVFRAKDAEMTLKTRHSFPWCFRLLAGWWPAAISTKPRQDRQVQQYQHVFRVGASAHSAEIVHFSMSTLKEKTSGPVRPPIDVTLTQNNPRFVRACHHSLLPPVKQMTIGKKTGRRGVRAETTLSGASSFQARLKECGTLTQDARNTYTFS